MGDFNYGRGFFHFLTFGPSAETGSCMTTIGQGLLVAAIIVACLTAISWLFCG